MIKMILNSKIEEDKLIAGCAIDICTIADYDHCWSIDLCGCDGGDCHISGSGGGGGAF